MKYSFLCWFKAYASTAEARGLQPPLKFLRVGSGGEGHGLPRVMFQEAGYHWHWPERCGSKSIFLSCHKPQTRCISPVPKFPRQLEVVAKYSHSGNRKLSTRSLGPFTKVAQVGKTRSTCALIQMLVPVLLVVGRGGMAVGKNKTCLARQNWYTHYERKSQIMPLHSSHERVPVGWSTNFPLQLGNWNGTRKSTVQAAFLYFWELCLFHVQKKIYIYCICRAQVTMLLQHLF